MWFKSTKSIKRQEDIMRQTGIEKASAVYFRTAAKRARKLLRSAMLWLIDGSYSFLTTDATESMTTSLALQLTMCSSSFWTLQCISSCQLLLPPSSSSTPSQSSTVTPNVASWWCLLTDNNMANSNNDCYLDCCKYHCQHYYCYAYY